MPSARAVSSEVRPPKKRSSTRRPSRSSSRDSSSSARSTSARSKLAGGGDGPLGQGHLQPPAALQCLPGPRPIHDDAPHEPCRHREELCAVLPSGVLRAQAQVRLVHEVGRSQRAARLVSQLRCRAAAQLPIHDRHQQVACLRIAVVPRVKQARDVARRVLPIVALVLHLAGALNRLGRLRTRVKCRWRVALTFSLGAPRLAFGPQKPDPCPTSAGGASRTSSTPRWCARPSSRDVPAGCLQWR